VSEKATQYRNKISKLREMLLSWYKMYHRGLPWRTTKDPYHIWISEVMLQQTRVDTVIPYYNRFIAKFPQVSALAKASEEEVLKLWEGLGYYSRARNLLSAAKEMEQNYQGKLPNTSLKLRKLKGFGPYTCAAVASIAFGEPVACVDGNVRRVISRIFALDKGIDPLAQSLVDPADPSNFNQAMMELGALVCHPKNPQCEKCPVSTCCTAWRLSAVDQYPPRIVKETPKIVSALAIVPHWKGCVFIRRRPSKGKWGGLWEFPTLESRSPIEVTTAVYQVKKDHRLDVTPSIQAGKFTHQLTHRTFKVSIWKARTSDGSESVNGEWIEVSKLDSHPFSRMQQKIRQLI